MYRALVVFVDMLFVFVYKPPRLTGGSVTETEMIFFQFTQEIFIYA